MGLKVIAAAEALWLFGPWRCFCLYLLRSGQRRRQLLPSNPHPELAGVIARRLLRHFLCRGAERQQHPRYGIRQISRQNNHSGPAGYKQSPSLPLDLVIFRNKLGSRFYRNELQESLATPFPDDPSPGFDQWDPNNH